MNEWSKVLAGMLTACTFAACGGGKVESPESVAQAVFEAVRNHDQTAFLARMTQTSDIDAQCPGLSAASRMEAEVELGLARDEAIRSFNACIQAVKFDGTAFQSAERSPSTIQALRWPGCNTYLVFDWLRVSFTSPTTPGTMLVTKVASIGNRWVFQSGVRLCAGPQP